MKEARICWLRQAATFSNVHAELEAELQRMKDRKLAQEFIEKKDTQIQHLVEFYNQTDSLIQAYDVAIRNSNIEIAFLKEMLGLNIDLKQELLTSHISNLESLIKAK